MDVFLDVLDTFVFDRLYAAILPDTTTTPESSGLHNRHVQLYVPLQPSQWADSSLWKRDDLLRQGTSLFLIIW